MINIGVILLKPAVVISNREEREAQIAHKLNYYKHLHNDGENRKSRTSLKFVIKINASVKGNANGEKISQSRYKVAILPFTKLIRIGN